MARLQVYGAVLILMLATYAANLIEVTPIRMAFNGALWGTSLAMAEWIIRIIYRDAVRRLMTGPTSRT